MNSFIDSLIFVHAILGGIALCSGTISFIAKKGKKVHKRSGQVFTYSMIVSGLMGMFITLVPDHESHFLFLIGLFSVYLTMSGYRAVRMKGGKRNGLRWFDYLISGAMLIGGIIMITSGIINLFSGAGPGYILLVFGLIGGWQAYGDFRYYNRITTTPAEWLGRHFGKMMGAYIASLTAFIVVNQIIPGIWGWFAPTILGLVYAFVVRPIDRLKRG